MRLSKYFLPILKEYPSEAKIKSHQLMLRAGMIKQSSSGIYSWLPLGLRVLKKIETIVNQEQIKAGHLPILMPTIQSAEIWKESDRYDDYGKEMLRIKDRHNRELLYGPTNEELVTDIFRAFVNSYKELPLTLYQIQWKFRDEIRPRFGIMRGREFFMKDGYSFDIDKTSALHSYKRHFVSYLKTFERMGLKAIPMKADTGPIGGDFSHEFLVLADTGESKVYYNKNVLDINLEKKVIDYQSIEDIDNIYKSFTELYASTEDTHNIDKFNEIPDYDRKNSRGIEVGQIFYFGTKYSKSMNANIVTKEGKKIPVEMGSHGIGVSRLVGAIIEANHDDYGIIWPYEVSPFQIALINIKNDDEKVNNVCNNIYKKLYSEGLDLLYDDRSERPGVKFASMDLIGIPWRITVGPRNLKEGNVELFSRRTRSSEILTIEECIYRCLKIKKQKSL